MLFQHRELVLLEEEFPPVPPAIQRLTMESQPLGAPQPWESKRFFTKHIRSYTAIGPSAMSYHRLSPLGHPRGRICLPLCASPSSCVDPGDPGTVFGNANGGRGASLAITRAVACDTPASEAITAFSGQGRMPGTNASPDMPDMPDMHRQCSVYIWRLSRISAQCLQLPAYLKGGGLVRRGQYPAILCGGGGYRSCRL